MKWLEIIKLRSVGSNRALIEKQLQDIIKELKEQPVKIYTINRQTRNSQF